MRRLLLFLFLFPAFLGFSQINSQVTKAISNFVADADLANAGISISNPTSPNANLTISGTSAGSDLIILQKNINKKALSLLDKTFIETTNGLNNIFTNNKNILFTTSKEATNQYGKPETNYFYEETDGQLEQLVSERDAALNELAQLAQIQRERMEWQAHLERDIEVLNQQMRILTEQTLHQLKDELSQAQAAQARMAERLEKLMCWLPKGLSDRILQRLTK